MVKISAKWVSLIGVLFFILLVININFVQVIRNLLRADFFWIFAAILTLIVDVFFMGKKWQLLVKMWHKKFSVYDAVKNYLIGVAYGSATPGRVGDFVKLFDLHKKTGMDKKKCFTLIFFDRIIDLTILTSSAFFGVLLLGIFFVQLNGPLFAFAVGAFFSIAVIALSIFTFFLEQKHLSFVAKIPEFFLPEKIYFHGKELFLKIQSVFKSVEFNFSFIKYLFFAFSGWLMAFFRPYLFALSIGITFSPVYFLLIIPATIFIEILPISLFGLGTRDAALILFFSILGATPEQMVSISMLILFFTNLPQVLFGIYFAWREKLKIHF